MRKVKNLMFKLSVTLAAFIVVASIEACRNVPKSYDVTVDYAKNKNSLSQKLHPATKFVGQKFSALDSFSYSKVSALRICRGFNLNEYIKKSSKIANWVEIMEYPPTVYLCNDTNYFLVSRAKNPTGRDTNFYHWMILSKDGRVIADMISFSKNTNNCFQANGKIHMVIYDYADDFFYKEQSELIPIVEKDFIIDNIPVLNKEREFYVEEN